MNCKNLVIALLFVGLFAHAQTAEEILDRNVEAMGGAAVMKKIKSYQVKATVNMMNTMTGEVTVQCKEGGKIRYSAHISAQGMQVTMDMGCDGERCYAKDNMMGTRLLEGQDREMFMMQNDFGGQANWRDMYTKFEYKGTAEEEGRKAHKIYIETKAGMKMTNYYDADSYLQVRSDAVIEGVMGTQNTVIKFKDYDDVYEGFLMAKTMNASSMGMNVVTEFTEFKVNPKPELSDDLFQLPEELRE